MKYAPHAYQKKAIKFLVERPAAGLFQDPGLGKTSETLAHFLLLYRKGIARRMLIIAPLRPANSVWPGEADKWEDFHGIDLAVLHEKGKALLHREVKGPAVDVINPEGLPWLFAAMKGRRWWWDILVVDESTRFKHSDTRRFRALRPQLNRFKRRVILTGTPAPNGLLDLFGQAFILDGGEALGKYITHYRGMYFYPTGFGGHTWELSPGAEKLIYKRLAPLVLRMAAEDYLDLPPLVTNDVWVDLPAPARKQYNEMQKLLLTAVGDNLVSAANAASATSKCRQIANGGAYLDREVTDIEAWEADEAKLAKPKFAHIHEAKTDAVEELVEELNGKPALIAYEYKHDLERLQRRFPGAPFLGGGVTAKKQKEVEAAWNRGELPVLFAQPQSVAHGLNLQGVGAAVIFYSIPWDLELYDQLVRRVWRQGQKERVVVHRVAARSTVDVAVLKALAEKKGVQDSLLKALQEYATSLPRRPK